MATPTYSDIRRYSKMARDVSKSAREEFVRRASEIDYSDWDRAAQELRELCRAMVSLYGMAASTLGAQWYDYCRRLAIGEGEPADALTPNDGALSYDMERTIHGLYAGTTKPEEMAERMGATVEKHVHELSRNTVSAALQRDYEAQVARGASERTKSRYRWTRVTVGTSCAFCTMLASRGAVYLSRESAGGTPSHKFHDDCDCVVLPFADSGDIRGYEQTLDACSKAYYDARNAIANHELPDELEQRIAEARRRHTERFEAGEVSEPWREFNEITMVMRWQNPGMH